MQMYCSRSEHRSRSGAHGFCSAPCLCCGEGGLQGPVQPVRCWAFSNMPSRRQRGQRPPVQPVAGCVQPAAALSPSFSRRFWAAGAGGRKACWRGRGDGGCASAAFAHNAFRVQTVRRLLLPSVTHSRSRDSPARSPWRRPKLFQTFQFFLEPHKMFLGPAGRAQKIGEGCSVAPHNGHSSPLWRYTPRFLKTASERKHSGLFGFPFL